MGKDLVLLRLPDILHILVDMNGEFCSWLAKLGVLDFAGGMVIHLSVCPHGAWYPF